MQRIIQFAIFLVLAATQLISAAPTFNTKLWSSRSILITPGNVRYLTNVIHSSATINSQSICFTTGTANEKLLQVPIAAAGELDAHASIRVTVGLTPVIGDSDPRISDGVNVNRFFIADTGNYGDTAPCSIDEGSHENELVTTHRVTPQFTFLFSPFLQVWACSSAQDGGYLNVGTFNKQVNPTNGLSLVIQRSNALEQYQFNYFLDG